MDEAKEAIRLSRHPSVRIGFSPGFSFSIILDTIRILEKPQNLTVLIDEGMDSYHLTEQILNGELDMVLVRNPSHHHKELISSHIVDDKLVLIFGSGHRLAHAKQITRSDLDGETMICYRRHTPIWLEIDEILGLKNLKRIEVSNNETLKSIVKSGLGFSVLPAIGIDPNEYSELITKPFAEINNISNKVYALYKKESPSVQHIKLIIQKIRTSFYHGDVNEFD